MLNLLLNPWTPHNDAIQNLIWGQWLVTTNAFGKVKFVGYNEETRKRIEVNEMRMLRWMCGVTCEDKIRNEHIRGTTRVTLASKKDHGETLELVRACYEER